MFTGRSGRSVESALPPLKGTRDLEPATEISVGIARGEPFHGIERRVEGVVEALLAEADAPKLSCATV